MLRLKVVRTDTVEIDSRETTCSPCAWLRVEMARHFSKGVARCFLFGKALSWPETVGEIERLPECRALDGSPDGTVVNLGLRG